MIFLPNASMGVTEVNKNSILDLLVKEQPASNVREYDTFVLYIAPLLNDYNENIQIEKYLIFNLIMVTNSFNLALFKWMRQLHVCPIINMRFISWFVIYFKNFTKNNVSGESFDQSDNEILLTCNDVKCKINEIYVI